MATKYLVKKQDENEVYWKWLVDSKKAAIELYLHQYMLLLRLIGKTYHEGIEDYPINPVPKNVDVKKAMGWVHFGDTKSLVVLSIEVLEVE